MTKEAQQPFDKLVSTYKRKNFLFNCIKNYEKRFIERTLQSYNLTTNNLLDIGCGAGDYIQTLQKFSKYIHGVDTSSKMLELAPSISHVCYTKSDLMSYPEDQKFTVITCFGVLEFNSNLGGFIQKIGRLAQKGSCIIIMAPRRNIFYWPYMLYHRLRGVNFYPHTSDQIVYHFEQFTKLKDVFKVGPLNFLYVFEVQ